MSSNSSSSLKNEKTMCVLLLLLLMSAMALAAPPSQPSLTSYLRQFGYLPHSESASEAQLTDRQLRDAVRNLQFFAGVNATGELDSVTAALLAKPRCGVPDVTHDAYRNKRYNLQGQRWGRTNLTWSLKRGASGMERAEVRRELAMALDLWARDTVLTFREMGEDEEADLQVSFHRHFHGDGYPFDGLGSVLAHAFFPGSGRGGDVHFDDDEAWAAAAGDRAAEVSTSVFAVAAHEFGHSLGLSHSSVEGALMFPWYSGVPDDRRLPRDDMEAVRQLYGGHHHHREEDEVVQEGPTRDATVTVTSAEKEESDPSVTGPPDRCETDFDAVAVIRSEMWVFKGRYFWRIDRDGGTREDPVELSAFWYGLPKEVERVDAVYERPDHKIVFFVGRDYYVLTGNSQLETGPIPIVRLGFPPTTDRVDGAMRWGWNGKTYFFSDTMYWRFDEDIQQVELDYPRDISIWGGVPYNIDAVFQYTDRKTYFFKGKYFWQFDDVRMRVSEPEPTLISQYWMHCPKEIKDPFKSASSDAAESSPTVPIMLHSCLLLPMLLAYLLL